MGEITEHTIDIDRILSDKMGRRARYVPRFLVSWLKRLIHQDQVNKFIWESRHLSGVEWLEACVRYLKMDIEIVGKENLPAADDGKLYTSSPTIRLAVRTAWLSEPSSDDTTTDASAIWLTTC